MTLSNSLDDTDRPTNKAGSRGAFAPKNYQASLTYVLIYKCKVNEIYILKHFIITCPFQNNSYFHSVNIGKIPRFTARKTLGIWD